ncbi:UDP-forming cellulose synthase catalytic subunit [Polymorphobacter sp.]|uniref:UDP-forming cellulose synthase catalytic subunit n=1 Tax=Polymorphobacter sp. TaxID=1909290 RepID=UPI003F6E46C3
MTDAGGDTSMLSDVDRSWPARIGTLLAGLAAIPLLVLVIGVPLDLEAQWLFAGASVLGAILIGRIPGRRATLAVALLSLIVSTRYLVWRTTQTLEFETLPELLLGGGLYLAEVYAWVILVLGVVQTSWPLDRPVVEIEGEPDDWPMVDVYIPTYNESLAIVRTTVFAAQDMDYPEHRYRIFILDDGRRPEFRAFAREAGCGYLTRTDNLHAKAGNLNAAMKRTDGELIAIFDCDHVPTRAFLQLTVGWFQKDRKLAVLQTPHHFYSSDPVQRNLVRVRDMPGEGELFYNIVQGGNDLWNAAFFCGSCAIIRREALAQTNGFAGETVTEDAHTALKLQRMGWNTAYINVRLSAGLATERLILHIGQRIRWARGMTQIFRVDNPMFGPGLSFQQRLCYLNAMLHFQFPLPRIVFITSPLAYLLAGQNIIKASAALIFAYALPHLFISMASSKRLQGGDRRPFWGEIYETLLAFHLVKPTLYTLINPHKGKFNVTDKGSLLDRHYFDFLTVRPHLITLALLVAGILGAFARVLFPGGEDEGQIGTLLLNTAWAGFSMMILLAAIAVARERRQTRTDIRIEVRMPVTVHFTDGFVVDGHTIDVSMGGLLISLPAGTAVHDDGISHVSMLMGDETLTLPAAMIRMEGQRGRISFLPLDNVQTRQLVRAVMGRSDAWQLPRPHPTVSGISSVADIASVAWSTVRAIFSWRPAPRAPATPAPASGPQPVKPKSKAQAIAAAVTAAAVLVAVGADRVHAQPAAALARSSSAPAAAPAVAPASPLTPSSLRLSLKDLQVRSPIRLVGTSAEIGIPFGMRRDVVVTGATLTLSFAYSPALLGDVSQLVVLLNGEVVQIMPMRPDAAGGQQVRIPINPALFLVGDNQLNIRFLGHYTRDCEDPSHSSLWANISNTRSFLDIAVQPVALRPDLGALPAPFFDRFAPGPLRLPFVFAASPTNGELEAAASVASWLGGQASYRTFAFRPFYNQLPKGNAVVFVTPSRRVDGVPVDITGSGIEVMVNPVDPAGQLLIVMGRDDRQLKQAAAAMATGRGLFAGRKVSTADARIPAYNAYGAPRWLRTDRPVQLGELVDPFTLQGRGLPPGPLTAPFRAAPDLFFWPRQGGRMNIHYRYPGAPWLDARASRLDISVNGQYLDTLGFATVPWWNRLLGRSETVAPESRASLILPKYILFGQNELIFDYSLVLANQKRCATVLPQNVRTSVLPDSSIDLSNTYHAAHMPDLATFAGAGYPFTVHPDLAQTVVVMQREASPDVVEAFLGVMGRFGDSTGVPASRVTVTRQPSAEQLEDKDILVIGTLDLTRAETLFATSPVQYVGGRFQVRERSLLRRTFDAVSPYRRDPAKTVEGFLTTASAFSGLTSFESPFSSARTVVAILAKEPETLPPLIAGLSDVATNAQVQGDLSVSVGEDMVSYAVSEGYWVGTLPSWLKIAFLFSQRPLLMALSGIGLALLLSGPVYLLLRRQRRKRLAGE